MLARGFEFNLKTREDKRIREGDHICIILPSTKEKMEEKSNTLKSTIDLLEQKIGVECLCGYYWVWVTFVLPPSPLPLCARHSQDSAGEGEV